MYIGKAKLRKLIIHPKKKTTHDRISCPIFVSLLSDTRLIPSDDSHAYWMMSFTSQTSWPYSIGHGEKITYTTTGKALHSIFFPDFLLNQKETERYSIYEKFPFSFYSEVCYAYSEHKSSIPIVKYLGFICNSFLWL